MAGGRDDPYDRGVPKTRVRAPAFFAAPRTPLPATTSRHVRGPFAPPTAYDTRRIFLSPATTRSIAAIRVANSADPAHRSPILRTFMVATSRSTTSPVLRSWSSITANSTSNSALRTFRSMLIPWPIPLTGQSTGIFIRSIVPPLLFTALLRRALSVMIMTGRLRLHWRRTTRQSFTMSSSRLERFWVSGFSRPQLLASAISGSTWQVSKAPSPSLSRPLTPMSLLKPKLPCPRHRSITDIASQRVPRTKGGR